jgi:glycosyltransferase involved in cell wall biosynthesis
MAAKTKTVCCLPIASQQNPYQVLMMEGLKKDGRLTVHYGARGKYLAVLRTWLRYRPDVMHFDWVERYFRFRLLPLGWLTAVIFLGEVMIVRYLLGCRIVWTMHEFLVHDSLHPQLEQWVQQRFARMCDWIRVFAPSTVKRTAAYLNIDPDIFRVLMMGSYIDCYPNTVSAAEARAALSIPSDTFVLLCLGVMRPYKGIDLLVQAFRQQPQAHWRLLIVGPPRVPQFVEAVKQLAQGDERIAIIDRFVAESDLQLYLNACDVVALPFRQIENSSSAMLGMSFARPVLAPTLGNLPELLAHQPALLYPPGHLDQALQTLAQISPDALRQMGQLNFQVAQGFRWEDFAALFFEDNR